MPVPTDRPYIIGETAFHHEGDKAALGTLIEEIAQLRVDAIKFHLLLDLDDYVTPDHPVAEPLKKWLFTKEEWLDLISKASALELDIVALCNDVASVQFIKEEQLPVRIIEIHATGINDLFLLQAAASMPQTIMIGIGGSTEDEVAFALEVLEKHGKTDVILMHGFQNYPTDHSLLDLGRIQRYATKFGKQMGFTDHTDPADPNNEVVSVLGLLLGANIIEKHFTPWPGEERIDHQAAISKDQMDKVILLADLVWKARGTGVDILSEAEKNYGAVGPMKKAIVARRGIPANKIIEGSDLAFKRSGTGSSFQQKEILGIIGSTSIRIIAKNEVLTSEMIKNDRNSDQ